VDEADDTRAPLPVLAEEVRVLDSGRRDGALSRVRISTRPAMQAAAAAAGGFVAGAAVVGIVSARQRGSAGIAKGRGRPTLKGRGKTTSAPELLQIVGSRTLLLDVHLLGGHGTDS
jgi:hypothetical protein